MSEEEMDFEIATNSPRTVPEPESPEDYGAKPPDTERPAKGQGRFETLAFSDEVLAQNFIDKHAADLRYTALWGRWLIWDGRRWAPDEKLETFSLIRKFCYERARQAESREAKSIASAGTVAAIERLARADQRIAVTVNEWDADPWLLNTPAGTVDLRTGKVSKHDPEDRLTKITGTAPDWKCPTPRWTRFLETVTNGNRELIGYLQRVAGYSLTGSTREHSLFFLYGTGANGKSTFVSVITSCAGEYHRVAPIETFTASNADAKIELISLKASAVYNSLFRWPRRAISHRTRSPYSLLSVLRRPAALLRREWFVCVGGLA